MIVNANIAMYALRAITKGSEDYIYNPYGERSCYYQTSKGSDAGPPSCGVGHALAFLGMTSEQLWSLDFGGSYQGIDSANMPNGWYLTTYARNVFAAFQRAQDRGRSWGEALERASHIYEYPIGY
jgi:hypothetical protein